MPAGFRRHLVGKTIRNVMSLMKSDVTYTRFVDSLNSHVDIVLI